MATEIEIIKRKNFILKRMFGVSTKVNYLSVSLYFLSSLAILTYAAITIYEKFIKKSPLSLGHVGILSTKNFILTISAAMFTVLIIASFAKFIHDSDVINRKIKSKGETVYSNVNNALYFWGAVITSVAAIMMLTRALCEYHYGKVTISSLEFTAEELVMAVACIMLALAVVLSVASFIEPALTEYYHKEEDLPNSTLEFSQNVSSTERNLPPPSHSVNS